MPLSRSFSVSCCVDGATSRLISGLGVRRAYASNLSVSGEGSDTAFENPSTLKGKRQVPPNTIIQAKHTEHDREFPHCTLLDKGNGTCYLDEVMDRKKRQHVRREKLGAELRRRREEKGLSLREVARKLNIKPPHLFRVETGDAAITEEPLTELCEILEADPEDVMTYGGQISDDFSDIMAAHPEPFNDLRKLIKDNPNAVFRVVRVVRDGKW
jgi:transcriptional regulator with XRE-family HTH domain